MRRGFNGTVLPLVHAQATEGGICVIVIGFTYNALVLISPCQNQVISNVSHFDPTIRPICTQVTGIVKVKASVKQCNL